MQAATCARQRLGPASWLWARYMKTAQLIQGTVVVVIVLGILSLFYTFSPQETVRVKPAKRDCTTLIQHERGLLEKFETTSGNLEAADASLKQMLKDCEVKQRQRFERRAQREAYCLQSDPAIRSLSDSLAGLRESESELDQLLEKASEEVRRCQG